MNYFINGCNKWLLLNKKIILVMSKIKTSKKLLH